eukprot:COSAG06_NODE_7339_length_2540_cov_7.539533_1_plen_28_part_10
MELFTFLSFSPSAVDRNDRTERPRDCSG